jgi:hypothetical protein
VVACEIRWRIAQVKERRAKERLRRALSARIING